MWPKPVSQFLNTKKHALHGLLGDLDSRNALLHKVQALLPEPLREHCLGATRSQKQLTLFVDSPAWGAKLRYLKTDILASLNKSPTGPVNDIVVRILPTQKRFQKTTKRALRPTGAGLSAIQQTADSIRNPELKEAMQRLAARLLSD